MDKLKKEMSINLKHQSFWSKFNKLNLVKISLFGNVGKYSSMIKYVLIGREAYIKYLIFSFFEMWVIVSNDSNCRFPFHISAPLL